MKNGNEKENKPKKTVRKYKKKEHLRLDKKHFEEALADKGYKTQRSFAEAFGVSERSLNHYMSDRGIPADVLDEFSQVLDAHPDYLTGKSDEKSRDELHRSAIKLIERANRQRKIVREFFKEANVEIIYKTINGETKIYIQPQGATPTYIDGFLYNVMIKNIMDYISVTFNNYCNSSFAYSQNINKMQSEKTSADFEKLKQACADNGLDVSKILNEKNIGTDGTTTDGETKPDTPPKKTPRKKPTS